MVDIKSKHGIVSRAPYELYMSFADMTNFTRFIPDDKKADIVADYDSIHAKVQGFDIGVRVKDRVPYSKIVLFDDGAPFGFCITLHFDSNNGEMNKTDFWIQVEADLNFMMKMMLQGKIQEGLDKMVDGLVAMSEGRMPEGVDPSVFPQGFNPNI